MLDEKDLAAIRIILKDELASSENLVLGEVSRVHENTNKQLEQLSKNIEELKQYYSITKLENQNTQILLQMITDLRREVEALKDKIA